jgi:hypothetical protein
VCRRGVVGAYTRMEGPCHESVEEGATKPLMKTTPDNRQMIWILIARRQGMRLDVDSPVEARSSG